MSRQLNLRVSDQFAERLDRVARRLGKPMASVLEAIGTPALESAEEDAIFESEALEAWEEEYQLTGIHLEAPAVEEMFAGALKRARSVIEESRRGP